MYARVVILAAVGSAVLPPTTAQCSGCLNPKTVTLASPRDQICTTYRGDATNIKVGFRAGQKVSVKVSPDTVGNYRDPFVIGPNGVSYGYTFIVGDKLVFSAKDRGTYEIAFSPCSSWHRVGYFEVCEIPHSPKKADGAAVPAEFIGIWNVRPKDGPTCTASAGPLPDDETIVRVTAEGTEMFDSHHCKPQRVEPDAVIKSAFLLTLNCGGSEGERLTMQHERWKLDKIGGEALFSRTHLTTNVTHLLRRCRTQ